MKFYIREWSENTIVLMTESGHVLAYFASIKEALQVCEDWYVENRNEIKQEVFVQFRKDNIGVSALRV